MDKKDKIKLISELVPTGNQVEILYGGQLVPYKIYEVPMELLSFNKYNGRIYSRTQSLENTSNKKLNLDNPDDVTTLKGFLWDSAPARNEHTYESILLHGQLEHGIITKDGIIIDGNRRASVIMKLNEEKGLKLKFKTIILEDELENNEHKVTDLETFYQIGIDGKVDYNPIEKYLKCEYLLKYHTIEEVSFLMSETGNRIKEWVKILDLMNEYLVYHNITGEFTRLDKREGHFVDLRVYLNNYSDSIKKSANVNWDYAESDLKTLKHIYFDFIFAGMPVSECRVIAKSAKSGGFFCYSEIWNEFNKEHTRKIQDLIAILDKQNLDKEQKIEEKIKLIRKETIENFNLASIKLQTIKDANLPTILLKRANNALNGIDPKKIDPADPEIVDLIKSIDSKLKEIKNV